MDNRISSWKEIANYLKCGVRTVQRWERLERLPVHRHVHQKNSTVYAFKHELDAWRNERRSILPELSATIQPEGRPPEAGLEPAAADSEGPPAEIVEGPPTSEQAAPVAATLPVLEGRTSAASPQRVNRIGIWLALAAGLVLAAYTVRQLFQPPVKPESGRAMVAVLPFANLSGDPSQDYFSDGLTEEMITELGRLDPQRLGVIARTSAMKYQHTEKDVAQIGRELGVGYILEGSVRRGKENVRISAQLIRVSDQTHLWARSYDFPARDVLTVQEEVARAITAKIQIKLEATRSAAVAAPRPVDPEAHEDYLKGRYFWNLRSTDGLRMAIDYFNRATQKDPNYAPAYAGIADCYTLLALYGSAPREVMPRAKAAALKSLTLDDSLPEAHTSLAGVEAIYDWNWTGAEHEFKRALELNPNYSPAHHWYANLYLIPQGRYDEAILEMKLAKALDPVSMIINTDLGWTYFVARQYSLALEQYKTTIEMSPGFVPVHYRLAQYYEHMHIYDAAAAQMEDTTRLDAGPKAAEALKRSYAEGGYRGMLQEQIKGLESDNRPPHDSAATLAGIYGEVGEKEQAFNTLQKAFQDRAPDLIYLQADPIYDSLRSDPRFQDIERQVGLTH